MGRYGMVLNKCLGESIFGLFFVNQKFCFLERMVYAIFEAN
jgi:hypothetical protein